MNLFIETENGLVKNHPAYGENLIQAFGAVPSHWEPFVRVEHPTLDTYEILDPAESTYAKVNGAWTDVWTVRQMTAEERVAKLESVRKFVIEIFNARPQSENWSAWVFDEDKLTMVPPIPRPAPDQAKLDAGIMTFWCGAENGWKDAPPRPVDSNQYKFDFIEWHWFQVTE
jgi:hypothetical protein